MTVTPKSLNRLMFFKLPLCYLAGVRVISLSNLNATVKIKHKWINQNPFKSMFWAAQGMAAEMSTGALLLNLITTSNRSISMLVIEQKAEFYKKATGKILFTCNQGVIIAQAISEAISTKKSQVISLTSKGVNESGVVVSEFNFEWSLKLKE